MSMIVSLKWCFAYQGGIFVCILLVMPFVFLYDDGSYRQQWNRQNKERNHYDSHNIAKNLRIDDYVSGRWTGSTEMREDEGVGVNSSNFYFSSKREDDVHQLQQQQQNRRTRQSSNKESNHSTMDDDNSSYYSVLKQPRIVGGNLTPIGFYPYYATPVGPFLCGSTVIYEDILITAAHCYNAFRTNNAYVNIGGTLIDGSQSEHIPIESVLKHPNYTAGFEYNDIMLVKLSYPSVAPPIALHYDDDTNMIGRNATVIGFGLTHEQNSTYSKELLQAIVTISSHDVCKEFWGPNLQNSSVLCATGIQIMSNDTLPTPTVTDTCQGDSGGPLLIKRQDKPSKGRMLDSDEYYEQIGIVSFGNGCGHPKAPAVYTKISAYIQWIQASICLLSNNPPSYCTSNQTNKDVLNSTIDLVEEQQHPPSPPRIQHYPKPTRHPTTKATSVVFSASNLPSSLSKRVIGHARVDPSPSTMSDILTPTTLTFPSYINIPTRVDSPLPVKPLVGHARIDTPTTAELTSPPISKPTKVQPTTPSTSSVGHARIDPHLMLIVDSLHPTTKYPYNRIIPTETSSIEDDTPSISAVFGRFDPTHTTDETSNRSTIVPPSLATPFAVPNSSSVSAGRDRWTDSNDVLDAAASDPSTTAIPSKTSIPDPPSSLSAVVARLDPPSLSNSGSRPSLTNMPSRRRRPGDKPPKKRIPSLQNSRNPSFVSATSLFVNNNNDTMFTEGMDGSSTRINNKAESTGYIAGKFTSTSNIGSSKRKRKKGKDMTVATNDVNSMTGNMKSGKKKEAMKRKQPIVYYPYADIDPSP